MRTAETILNIIRTRGQRGLPVEDVYRLLYNPNLYLRAYAKLNSNAGAMTPGATPETVDGMSLEAKRRHSLPMQGTKLLNSWVTKSTYCTPMINTTIVVKDVSMVV